MCVQQNVLGRDVKIGDLLVFNRPRFDFVVEEIFVSTTGEMIFSTLDDECHYMCRPEESVMVAR